MKDTVSFMAERLDNRKSQGNIRTLRNDDLPFDFLSNDYLGLARNRDLYDQIEKSLKGADIKMNGSGGSRLLSGNNSFTENLERRLSTLFKSEASLLFNSGYNANLALLSAIAQREDTILYDQLSHVCLKEGAWLSPAQTVKFRHNDMTDLEQKLKEAQGNKFIVTESVFSMDGDFCPIEEIIDLSKKYDVRIIVDEAHSTGCFGENGNGWLCEKGSEEDVFARVYTFGKGLGVHGACVCGSQLLIDYLINFGRAFIYTTALPMHSVIAIDEAFNFIESHPNLIAELNGRINHFRNEVRSSGLELPAGSLSDTSIQPIIIPGNDRIKHITNSLNEEGFDIRPILAPTVSSGTERIRLSLHVHNTNQEITELVNSLAKLI